MLQGLVWIDRLNLAASRKGGTGVCMAINLHEGNEGSALMRATFVRVVSCSKLCVTSKDSDNDRAQAS